jgi:hypothetical protein
LEVGHITGRHERHVNPISRYYLKYGLNIPHEYLKMLPPTRVDSIGGLSGINHRRLPVICHRLGIPTAIYYNDEAIHLLQETSITITLMVSFSINPWMSIDKEFRDYMRILDDKECSTV